MHPALGLIVLVGGFGLLWLVMSRKANAAFVALTGYLNAKVIGERALAATYLEVPCTLRWSIEIHGRTRTSVLRIDAPLPRGFPFVLNIEPGEELGAPAEVVRRTLTPTTRALLPGGVRIATPAGMLRLEVRDSDDGDTYGILRVEPLLNAVVAIVRGVREHTVALDAEIPVAPGGDPHRPIPDESARRAAKAAREQECVALAALLNARARD